MGTHGRIFIGRDEKTYGKEGTGWVDYDPDYECVGELGTLGRRCPHTFDEYDYTFADPDRTLHVAIASYRDNLCPTTLYNLFTKAEHPGRLHVRVLQQNIPGEDPDCLEAYCEMYKNVDCPYRGSVEVHQVHATEAAGPLWARGVLSQDIETAAKEGKIDTQDYCMSIDSHMDFEPNWDTSMVVMWNSVKNEYGVLSTYVVDVDQLGKNLNGVHEVPHLCMVTFTSNVRTHATKCAQNLSRPKLTNAVWGAGLSFSKCHAELKVPVDRHPRGVFDGEEFNRAARFFTYGYDIYTPNRVYVLHNYHRTGAKVYMSWSRNVQRTEEANSNIRLKTMIDVPGGERDLATIKRLKQSKFGLGDRRSLDQLIKFSGIDLRQRRASLDGKNRCGNIKWVPFEEHPKGVNYIPDFSSETEDPLDPPDPTSVWFVVGNAATEKLSHSNSKVSSMEKVILSHEHHGHNNDRKMLRDSPQTNNDLILSRQSEHRYLELPLLVKVTACVLAACMLLVITYTRGTGGRNQNRKKKRRN